MKVSFSIVFCILCIFGFDSKAQVASYIDTISQSELKSFLRSSQSSQVNINYEDLNVYYTRCEWEVDPAVNFISGNVTSYFTSDNSIDSITFDCSQYLVVDSVFYH